MTKGLIIFALKSLSELLHPQKIGKIADEELGSNHVDSESDETISKSELLDEETNLFSNKKKSKKSRKGRKFAWKDSTTEDLVDCICFNKYAKKIIIFINTASKNIEI